MCRESLPVWQQFRQAHRDVTVIGVAVGAEGVARVTPYVEAAGVQFEILLDERFALGKLFGFDMLRNVAFVGADGIIQYVQAGGFDLRYAGSRDLLKDWADDPAGFHRESTVDESMPLVVAEALRSGSAAWRRGDREGAMGHWRRALRFDPGNHLVRDQLWSVEHPERYFDGDVDKAWQITRLADEP